ncbi:MAG: ATP-binding cassette domain-containing protein [Betaproteobacteria bacterium]|nr:ATP-binding cassette domain-containing protein [Betaproteobacteria bacterium]
MHYPAGGGWLQPRRYVHALDGVSFELGAGETVAVVGESGCGKSTLGRCIVRLVEPTAGEVMLEGQALSGLDAGALRTVRQKMQIVFQDPYASLNPRRTIFQSVADPLRVGGVADAVQRRERVAATLDQVGLGAEFMQRHPHELSGGQRQRVAIARAIAMRPKLVVCDEPVSSLDVSIQAQVINLLKKLQRELGMAYLFITHDLKLVPHIANRVLVMYLGEVVESAPAHLLEERRLHPYSQALFSAAPVADPALAAARRRIVLKGEVPSPMNPPPGCRFHTRCAYRQPRCSAEAPALRPVLGRLVRCHFAGDPGFTSEEPA